MLSTLPYNDLIKMFVDNDNTNFFNMRDKDSFDLLASYILENCDGNSVFEGLFDYRTDENPGNVFVAATLLGEHSEAERYKKRLINNVFNMFSGQIQHDLDEGLANFRMYASFENKRRKVLFNKFEENNYEI